VDARLVTVSAHRWFSEWERCVSESFIQPPPSLPSFITAPVDRYLMVVVGCPARLPCWRWAIFLSDDLHTMPSEWRTSRISCIRDRGLDVRGALAMFPHTHLFGDRLFA